MHAPEHFAMNFKMLSGQEYFSPQDLEIKTRMDAPLESLSTRCTYCTECLPCPEGINIPEVLRFRNMLVAWDMKRFGKYRYNMIGTMGHWFPGEFASHCTECGDCLPRCPENLEIPRLLRETHHRLFDPKTWLVNKVQGLAGIIVNWLKKLTRTNKTTT